MNEKEYEERLKKEMVEHNSYPGVKTYDYLIDSHPVIGEFIAIYEEGHRIGIFPTNYGSPWQAAYTVWRGYADEE